MTPLFALFGAALRFLDGMSRETTGLPSGVRVAAIIALCLASGWWAFGIGWQAAWAGWRGYEPRVRGVVALADVGHGVV